MSDTATPVCNSTDLDALAEAYGIELEFVDAHGNVQRTAADTKRALLRAMNVEAENDSDVRAATAAFDNERWQRALPAAMVARVNRVEVPLVLPRGTREIAWRIEFEDGGECSGRCVFSDLPFLQKREFGGAFQECRRLDISSDLPQGYHRLSIDSMAPKMHLIITPAACWLPPAITAGERLSGVSLQLYLVRSAANWGIGDFTDLRAFVDLVAARGADVVGVNPLHAMFGDAPEQASPYSPASRLLLNVLNIDLTAIPEFDSAEARALLEQPGFGAALEASRAARYVDYSAVAGLKLEMSRVLFKAFSESATRARQTEFASFRAGSTPAQERTYIFTALRAHFAARQRELGAWQKWPSEYTDPASPAVEQFAQVNAAEITFIAWQQWIADCQLSRVARAAGPMRVGLYRDLAVGADPGGAESWCNRAVVADCARIGAPPDIVNPAGQNWDLPPYDPLALQAQGYASFIELVRANMRYAGGLRIDHVMALRRLYWIPTGAAPEAGGYVRYPLEDLIGILALESHRAQCLVVGEDLGTVPAGFRERLQSANILSYRVLFFERDESGVFAQPASYPRSALAVLGSHDLPTLDAWWSGADIGLRERLELFTDVAADAARQTRGVERDALLAALRQAHVLEAQPMPNDAELFAATHAFLAQTAAALAVAQLDDITAESEPVNVPTTSDERPNWRRRLARTLEDLDADPRWVSLFDEFRAAGRLRDVPR